MIVGLYSADFYCDNPECEMLRKYFVQYAGINLSQCVQQAKQDGWKMRGNAHICPHCAQRGIRPAKKYKNGYMGRVPA